MAAVMFYPLMWMIGASFRDDSRINDPGIFPGADFTFDGYTTGWEGTNGVSFATFLFNSFIIAALAVVGTVASSAVTAYAFARIEFAFKRFWFGVLIASLFLPLHVLIIPQYLFFREVGWVNTWLPLVVPKLLASEAFFVYLLVQFFRSVPRELDEAARIDGCGHFRIFWQMILPLSKPALATAAIFTFIYTWNDFFAPLIYLTDTNLYTVPLALRSFIDSSGGSSFSALFAMSIVSLLPVIGLFVAFQRLLTSGISTTDCEADSAPSRLPADYLTN
ncbi:carbohydrate ABC transporter permease [Saccharomonospora sp. NPDC046836]|uniref:carbohydrate ABC transporter permease n=1 Tax=Saccharomonospora sp. NPDC046836 TaxID=3156921 RepID=UPI00340D7E4D